MIKMNKKSTDKIDLSFTDEHEKIAFLLKSMQENGLLLKFPVLNNEKHITILGEPNGLSFHIKDESKTEKGLKYPYRIEIDLSNINSHKFDNTLCNILLSHLQIYSIDKLPYLRYLTMGTLINKLDSYILLNKKHRLSIPEYCRTVFVVARRFIKYIEMDFWFTLRRESGASAKWYIDGIVVLDLVKDIGCYLPLKVLREIEDYCISLFKINNVKSFFNGSSTIEISRSEMDRLRRNFKLFFKSRMAGRKGGYQ